MYSKTYIFHITNHVPSTPIDLPQYMAITSIITSINATNTVNISINWSAHGPLDTKIITRDTSFHSERE